jgi:hypothetical protein
MNEKKKPEWNGMGMTGDIHSVQPYSLRPFCSRFSLSLYSHTFLFSSLTVPILCPSLFVLQMRCSAISSFVVPWEHSCSRFHVSVYGCTLEYLLFICNSSKECRFGAAPAWQNVHHQLLISLHAFLAILMVVLGCHSTHVTTIKCSSHAATVAVIVGGALVWRDAAVRSEHR